MFGNPVSGAGTHAGGYHGNRARSQTEGQEERFVEGDLFGSTKGQSLRSADPPTGQPPRSAYYDGVDLSTFSNGSTARRYSQNPTAQASPFARRSVQPNGFVRAGRASTGGAGVFIGGGYDQANEVTGAHGEMHAPVESTTNVALVPTDSNGGTHGRSMMDDDDDLPTRSLAYANNFSAGGGIASGGLRHRRAGEGRAVSVGGPGLGRLVEPEVQRATWVVVWGAPAGKANDVLTRFLQFGRIEEKRAMPGSNWLYFKYATRLQADKALAAGHGSRLTDTVMLGVQKVVDDEVWQALREGRVPPLSVGPHVLPKEAPGGRVTDARTPNASNINRDAMEIEESDLVGNPQRPRHLQNVCAKIMAWFGFY